jgi:glycosyltransferase involved in cell wall biosynthesis
VKMDLDEQIDFCLLIPCYNNRDGLVTSLNSVVYPGKYTILVVDDGSKERLDVDNITKQLNGEKPLVILHNEKNLGITATLNNGLSWIEKNANAKYVARLDCGDRCLPGRFVKQVQLMDENPQLTLTGTWCRIVDEATSFNYSYTGPTHHEGIKKAMYAKNVFMHATVMFSTPALKKTGYYPTNFEYAEDYALFWKLVNAGQTAIIPEYLVTCELNKSGISFKNKRKQLLARARVIKTFGKSIVLKILAYVRLLLLFVLPKPITLQLKKWKG